MNVAVNEFQGGHMSRWKNGFVNICQVDELRTAECRVDECFGTYKACCEVSEHKT